MEWIEQIPIAFLVNVDGVYKPLGPLVAQLKAENERLREYYDASQAVEADELWFDLHHEAVERLRKATKALGGE